jgi:hypothetical protein
MQLISLGIFSTDGRAACGTRGEEQPALVDVSFHVARYSELGAEGGSVRFDEMTTNQSSELFRPVNS